ncbi:MAG: HEAT repeat domain-containing protein, partial [Polyangiales bacterium]
DRDLARRAAFALPVGAGPEREQVLIELAADSGASLRDRERALQALAQSKSRTVVDTLLPLLDDVRLRPAVARCLGQLGGKPAVEALLTALNNERYPEARGAEVEALVGLKNKRVLPKIVRFLGTETGLPGGLEQWARLRGSGRVLGGVLIDMRAGARSASLRGTWSCRGTTAPDSPAGCRPAGGKAELEAPRSLPDGQGRVVFTVWASSGDDWLRVHRHELQLHRGRNEVAVPIHAGAGATRFPVQASQGAFIELIGIVPRAADVPPPPPEPVAQVTD